MTSFIAANLAPIMFGSLLLFLFTGFPVAFALAATGMTFGWIAVELGVVPGQFFGALPLRLYGIMANDVLLAIPFFTFMGLVLERSRMAEDLLDTIGQVFGPIRGGLAIAVVLVGAMLAATTGVVAASVISMGLISLPIMLRYGYNRPLAAGVITASGTLAQIIPPSIVLIVIADQLGQSVGEMYKASFIPAFMLVGIYVIAIMVLAVWRPQWVPALPPSALVYHEENGNSGHKSLGVLTLISAIAGALTFNFWPQMKLVLGGDPTAVTPTDEKVVMALMLSIGLAWLLALMDKGLRLNLLSTLARRVTFVLIPPLLLIFLVLGTIFLGLATPTEGGAMGASGAVLMAWARGRLKGTLLKQALDASMRLAIFVMFVLVGSTIFALTFQAIDGPIWVKALFAELPGGTLGFLLFVNTLIFILGCFLDFFEIAFILLPLLLPVLKEMDINLIWFGVMVALILQTSFLTPPFGFALFYLRSVAPGSDYTDKVTGQRIKAMKTGDIYKGSIAFVILQLIMVVAVMWQPQIILYGLGEQKVLDVDSVNLSIEPMAFDDDEPGAAAPKMPAE
ncbi:TRAP transporter large permease subunit [Limnohabitans sp.]|uniref:TRAP transporter large permease n=1 Tax=Limnohabitans sp. TaxID=1907725 RepID=UPI003341639A